MKFLLLFILVVLSYAHQSFNKNISQQLLNKIMPLLQFEINDNQYFDNLKSLIEQNVVCSACHQIVKTLKYVPSKQILFALENIAVQYCVLKKIQAQKSVCKGAVHEMASYLLASLWGKLTDPHSLCHKIRLCPNEYQILNADDYAKNLLKDKPNKTQEEPTLRKVLNIMHISDIHLDFFYTQGTPISCTLPICCRTSDNGKNGSALAGYWGVNNGDCDIPFHTFNLFLQQISKKNIDAIIWTGDNTAHDIWRQSEEYNLNFTTIISDSIKTKLPNITVIPAMGNHQSYPCNVYEFGKQDFLNTVLANSWSSWIGDNASQMMKQKGYFSFKIDSYNLTILSINTQAWNDLNWVLIKDPTDPGDMLKWMEQQLKKAESLQQKVFIVGHIPPNKAMIQWGLRYNALIDRFSYTIRGQFYGHTHNDHLAFFTAINDTKQQIINSYFVAPSLTTYSDKNPRYRIMKVDLDTMRVLDYDQFALKLQNNYSKDDKPSFEKTYSFLQQYELSSMSFENMQLFRSNLRNDSKTQIKYTFHKNSQLRPGSPSKTINCQTYATIQMVKKCQTGQFKKQQFDKVAGPWKILKH